MSSADEDDAPSNKRRKIQRACDSCRRKKIKCDGPERPDNRCSRCTARGVECTYKEPFVKGGYPNSYVEKLESRLERMEKLINKLCPDADVSDQLDVRVPNSVTTPRTAPSQPSPMSTSHQESSSLPGSLSVTPQIPASPDGAELSDHDEEYVQGLVESLRKLSAALELKNQHPGRSGQVEPQERASYKYPWLRPDSTPLFNEFPPQDLLHSLVGLYFRRMNDMFPLLHEPTFTAGLNVGLHLRDSGFGAVVLLVCACAAPFTNDPRVLLSGTDDRKSAGWKWFQAVEDWRKVTSSMAPAQLYDLQVCVLMANFLMGSAAPQATWTLIGAGIRMAVDVGAHRRKMYNTKATIEDELWRRAFWNLVVLEWSTSYGLGRPFAIQDEDIDVALPTEVDDEYWPSTDSDESPRQPEGKPSKISFFVAYIRLTRNIAFASRTVYSINRNRPHLGQGDPQWEQRVVAELDSSLNNWVDSLSSHLRWIPEQQDPLFLTQSATLQAHYYYVQIAVHRPFMAASYRDSPLSFPSVIICTNAARSSIQVLDVLYQRNGHPHHRNMGLLFMSGIILMMNIWGQRRAGRLANVQKDIAVLRRAMVMLDFLKDEVQVSGALRDLLEELVTAAESTPLVGAETAPQHGQTKASGVAPAQSVSSQFTGAQATSPHPSEAPAVPQARPGTHSERGSGHSLSFVERQLQIPNAEGSSTSGASYAGFEQAGSLFPPASGFSLHQHPFPQAPDDGMDSHAIIGGANLDFAFMDDTLSMWTNAPSSFRMDDWGTYFHSANAGTESNPRS